MASNREYLHIINDKFEKYTEVNFSKLYKQ